jgi:leucyl aminopeptidase
MPEAFCEADTSSIPISVLDRSSVEARLANSDSRDRAWIAANHFTAAEGQILVVPNPDGGIGSVLIGTNETPGIYALAAAPTALPPGDYHVETPLDAETANRVALGWGLGSYSFDRYRKLPKPRARLVWPANADRARVSRELAAIRLVRDLVNTPANDMGPVALAEAAHGIADAAGAECRVTVGEALLSFNYPAVHAVGRAAAEAPRVVDIGWGDPAHPHIVLVGKGITFDTGGLDLKTGSTMALMKKDMGGAAHALALGQMIMDAKLPVRLRLLIAIAENSVGPQSYRPGDVIKTRAGLSVEVGNTDAEGRVVLADMLTAACEAKPLVILDFATLTGAARVALGPDLPALFATDRLADDILASSAATDDPIWRLPLWQPYRKNLDSKIADINNDAGTSFAGAIHGALFLQAFVQPDVEWAHFDLYAWNAGARAGRPAGGEAFAIRALFDMLARRYAS